MFLFYAFLIFFFSFTDYGNLIDRLGDVSRISTKEELESTVIKHSALSKLYNKDTHIEALKPRDYQEAIVERIWDEDDKFGRIISLETGLGKTFISLMFLCKQQGIDYNKIIKSKNMSIKRGKSFMRAKIVFLVPTRALLDQQTTYFTQNTPDSFKVFSLKSSNGYSGRKKVFPSESSLRNIWMVSKNPWNFGKIQK